ncbi:hypothetical protein [Streptomyces griseosporeus]|uniref:hypothetical protein n=1 Tax=Streptomyces griseosporeus TaxID=1910 RepID=UPI0036CE74CC
MFPALDQLMQLMPPPPTAPAPTPWQLAPDQIGFQFPADYRAFIDAYGAGEINQHLNVLAPTSYPYQPGLPPGFPGYTAFAEQDIYAAFCELRNDSPADYPFPLFPEPDGLLIWARSLDGDCLFWDTGHPDPDQWTCNLWLLHQPPPAWHPFDGTATELLLALTTRAHPHANVLIPSDPAPPRWTRTEDWRHRPAPTSQTEGGMHR